MEAPMLSPDRIQNPMPLAAAAADYDVVRRAIGHIRGHWREQPEIEAIAEAAGVTPTELHHLFRRWAGPRITTWCAAPSAISAAIGASSPRSKPSPKPPASRRRNCTTCSGAGPG